MITMRDHQFRSLRNNTHLLSHSSVVQPSGLTWLNSASGADEAEVETKVPTELHSFRGSSGEELTPERIQSVGGIQFLAAVGLRFPFPSLVARRPSSQQWPLTPPSAKKSL